MAVRTRRFALTRIMPSSVNATVYTVPADRTAIVKDVRMFNNGALLGTIDLTIIPPVGNARVILRREIPAGGDVVLSGAFIVLLEGDKLAASTNPNADVHLTACGALLVGDPE